RTLRHVGPSDDHAAGRLHARAASVGRAAGRRTPARGTARAGRACLPERDGLACAAATGRVSRGVPVHPWSAAASATWAPRNVAEAPRELRTEATVLRRDLEVVLRTRLAN